MFRIYFSILNSKNMKALLFSAATLIAIITFSSCKKTTASSPYYVKATINGVNVVYNGLAQAVNIEQGTLYIYGYNSDAITTADGITLRITKQGQGLADSVSIGTYTDTANHDYGITNRTWNPYTATITSQQFGTDYVNVVIDDTASATPFTCIVTAINDSSISGTFSGIVHYGFNSNSPFETITNGSFYVPF
jgi:hypothetical protein